MNVEFAFSLDQQVTITVNGKTGRIEALYVDADNIKRYLVEYTQDDGQIRTRYFREAQIVA